MFYSKMWVFLSVFLFVPGAASQERISIGVSLALSGDASSFGNDIRNALIFANEKLTGNKYNLIFEDDRCSGKEAVTVAQRFVNIQKLKYATGFACSSTLMSTAAIYEKAKVLVIASSASAPELAYAGDYIFRTFPNDALAAKKLYDYIAEHHKKFGIISDQTDYTQGFEKAFIASNEDGAIEIFTESYIGATTSDFRSSLLKLKSKGVEGIFINTQTEYAFLAVLKQLKELDIPVKVYSAYWAGSVVFLNQAGALSEDIVYVDLPGVSEALNPTGRAIFEEYVQRFGKPSSIELIFATSFEAMRALHMAIESKQDLRSYLYSAKFEGIFGPWEFDKNGEIEGLNFSIKRIKNGKSELIN